MKECIDLRIVKNAELILRGTMSVTLLVAGISKFFSHGGFYHYYLQEFSKEGVRISLQVFLFDGYLAMIPYLEVGIGVALMTTFKRRLLIVVWIVYFITLEIGHYLLEQFQAVNMMIPFIIMGTFAYMLLPMSFELIKADQLWLLTNQAQNFRIIIGSKIKYLSMFK